MGEERMEVLRMIAEKKVTVEEGERLLRALDDRERGQPPPRPSDDARGRERSSGFIAEMMGSIGTMVQGVVNEALGGFGMMIHGRESLTEVALEDATPIAEGTR